MLPRVCAVMEERRESSSSLSSLWLVFLDITLLLRQTLTTCHHCEMNNKTRKTKYRFELEWSNLDSNPPPEQLDLDLNSIILNN